MKKITDKPDLANCTYWWYMYLNEGNKRPVLVGYSKWVNQAEAISKQDCLMSKIEMFQKNDWLQKTTHIEIYRRISPLPNKANDPLILTLYPNDYKIPSKMLHHYEADQRVKTFLNNFYAAINGEKKAEYLRPGKNKISKDGLFDLSRLHFRKLSDLSDYTFKLLSDGHPKHLVEHLHRGAISKFFPNL